MAKKPPPQTPPRPAKKANPPGAETGSNVGKIAAKVLNGKKITKDELESLAASALRQRRPT